MVRAEPAGSHRPPKNLSPAAELDRKHSEGSEQRGVCSFNVLGGKFWMLGSKNRLGERGKPEEKKRKIKTTGSAPNHNCQQRSSPDACIHHQQAIHQGVRWGDMGCIICP